MARRRKFQWIDNLNTAPIVVAAGAVSTTTQITEAELENLGGGVTLMRVVGDIIPLCSTVATNGAVTFALFTFEQYTGSVAPTDWSLNDTYQGRRLLGTWLWRADQLANRAGVPRSIHVDLRTKRKLGQGIAVSLAVENHASQPIDFVAHLRLLLLLP